MHWIQNEPLIFFLTQVYIKGFSNIWSTLQILWTSQLDHHHQTKYINNAQKYFTLIYIL